MPLCNWRQKTSVFCFSAYSVTQSCLILCDSLDYSLPGSSVYVISQARILECFAISSCRGSFPSRDSTHISCVSFIGSGFFVEPSGKPLIAFVHKWYLDKIYHWGSCSPKKKTFYYLQILHWYAELICPAYAKNICNGKSSSTNWKWWWDAMSTG